MNLEKLTDENFLLFCATHYDNSKYTTTEDFFEDLNRIKYIKKLVTRFIENGDLRERLILNHIIVLNNCFGPEILSKICFLKLRKQIEYVKPFLIFINALPDKLFNIGDSSVINTDEIPMNQQIILKLRQI